MRRLARLLAGSAIVACGPKPPPAAVARAEDAALVQALAAQAVDATHFARRTLYTWTTHEQVVALQKTKRLLVRDESPTQGASVADAVLHARMVTGDPIAKLLYTTTFAKARFAWPNPWATRRGWPGETYGGELIEITLKPDAIVLAFSNSRPSFVAHDLADRDVPLDTVLAHPERIAALYFTKDEGPVLYREYIVCNESMIEAWAVGTDAIARALASEARMVEQLASYLAEHPSVAPDARAIWAHADAASLEHAYVAALAFVNGWYALDADAMITLAQALRETPRTLAFTGTATQPFPGIGAARPAPRVVAKPAPTTVGTYATPPQNPVP